MIAKRSLAGAILVVLVGTAHCRTRGDDPYWEKIAWIDVRFREVLTMPSIDEKRWRPERIKKLQMLRRAAAHLAHPKYSDEYHSLKIGEMESWISMEGLAEIRSRLDELASEPDSDRLSGPKRREKAKELEHSLEQMRQAALAQRRMAEAERRRVLRIHEDA